MAGSKTTSINSILCLLAIGMVCVLGGCTSISLSKPVSSDFAAINVLTVGPNGGPDDNGAPTVQVISIHTPDGSQHLEIPGEKPHIKVFYLRPGKYTLKLDCLRNWPLPDNATTTRLPFGLGLDDASETFQVSVESGQRYLLDCIPGMTKSQFIFSLE